MHEVALAALETEFRNMKDDQKKPLRDYRLVELAGRHHPWVPTVYESANSWVHLSPRQLTGPLTPTEVPGRLNVKVRHVIDDYPEAFLSEVLDSMRACTEEILAYVENWVHTKNDPSAGEQV